jgi:hypothetical protein
MGIKQAVTNDVSKQFSILPLVAVVQPEYLEDQFYIRQILGLCFRSFTAAGQEAAVFFS